MYSLLHSCSNIFHQMPLALDLSHLGSQNLEFYVSLQAIIFIQLTYQHFFPKCCLVWITTEKKTISCATEPILFCLLCILQYSVYVCLFVCLSTHPPIYLSMALQPFVRLRPLSSVFDRLHRRWDSLDEGSARRETTTYTQDSTNTE
jgi:hypothetical protein